MPEKKISPWIRGVVDTLVGASLIRESRIPTKNRLVVILVDTAFEIACRAYLKYKAKITLDKNHSRREVLVKIVKSKLVDVDETVWENINYYYTEIRCDFYHQSAGKTVTDTDLLDYQETVEFVIDKAFGIQIDQLVKSEVEALGQLVTQIGKGKESYERIALEKFNNKKDKILIGVSQVKPSSVEEVNEYFKREGESLRLKQSDFGNVVARNKGTKKFFFYNRQLKRWELSGLGKFRFEQFMKGDKNEQ